MTADSLRYTLVVPEAATSPVVKKVAVVDYNSINDRIAGLKAEIRALEAVNGLAIMERE